MKKRTLLPLLAVAAAMASSCLSDYGYAGDRQEDSGAGHHLTDKIFTADFGTDTKAELTDGYKVKWNSGDRIVIYGNNSVVAVADIDADNEYRATFAAEGLAEAGTYYAVYPAASSTGCSEGELTVNLPVEQTATAGSFDKDAVIAAAVSEDCGKGGNVALCFRNLCGLVGIEIPSDDVETVVISSLGNDVLAGEAKAFFDESGNPVIVPVSGGASHVVLKGRFEKGKTYYASVFPGDCPAGISVTFTYNSGEVLSYNIHRGKALPSRSRIRRIDVSGGFTPQVISDAVSFKAGDADLVSDYDINVFAKQNVPAGKLTDQAGNAILGIPFAAARIVVNKNTGTVDVYGTDNDLQPLTVKWHPNGNTSVPVQETTVQSLYLRGEPAGWSTTGKEIGFKPSAADPQIMVCNSQWSWGGRTQFAIFRSGTIGGADYNINNSYVFTCPLTDAGEKQENLVLPLGKWMPLSGGADSNSRGSYYNLQKPDFIVLDLRNMRIYTEKKL